MSLAQALANIIQQEAHSRGQLGIRKSTSITDAISRGADDMQGALAQMGINETRGLQNQSLKRRGRMEDLDIDRAERDAANEKEIEAILKAIPDGPDAMQKRVEAFVKFWQAKDPKKALAMQKSLMDQDVAASLIGKNDAAAMASRAAATREREGGNVVAPGGAFIPFGADKPSFTNPALPPKDSNAGAGRYVDLDKGDGKGVRRFQYNTETDTYDKDLGAPPPSAKGERQPYGQKTFATGYDKDGNPVALWIDPVNETIKPAKTGFARTEPRDIAQGTQAVLQGVDLTLPVLNELQTELKKLDSGPFKGRLSRLTLKNLGGSGLEPSTVATLTKMGRLRTDQIFGDGGKSLTVNERELIEPYTISETDTLQTAMAKLPELLKRTQRIKESRLKMMNTRTKGVYESREKTPTKDKAARLAEINKRLAEMDKEDAK